MLVIRSILDGNHIDDFANGVVAYMFFKSKTYFSDHFVFTPLTNPPSGHFHIASYFPHLYLFSKNSHFFQQTTQI
jgi:hypothetical protein